MVIKLITASSQSSSATAAAREERPVEEQVAALNALNIGFECRDRWAVALKGGVEEHPRVERGGSGGRRRSCRRMKFPLCVLPSC